MTCSHCNRSVDRAAADLRSIFVDGFEVLVRLRKVSPGEGVLCAPCADGLAMRAVMIWQVQAIEQAEDKTPGMRSRL